MFARLAMLPHCFSFWVVLFIGMIWLESTALFFQYFLHEDPCVLCVYIRAVVMLIMATSFFGMIFSKIRVLPWVSFFLIPLEIIWLLSYSKKLLLIEQGALLSTCGMNAEFPAWMALDRWLPFMFQPTGLCGKAIYLIPDVSQLTMVEVLHYGFLSLLIVYVSMALITIAINIKIK